MTTLLFDCHYLCHQARYSFKDLRRSDGIRTGVIYGFLSRIIQFGTMFKTNQIIFCWDSNKSIRKLHYPEYKKKPPLSPEEYEELKIAKEQFELLRTDILPRIGFNNNLMKVGYEADDIIGIIVRDFLGEYVIIAGDEDMYQLLYGCRIWQPQKNKMMTAHKLWEEYNVRPPEWTMVKQIAGCTSDNVKGIKGVHNKTAIKYLRNKLSETSKVFQAIKSEEGQQIIERNRLLVSLPLAGMQAPVLAVDSLNIDKFIEVCDEFELNSFLEDESKLRDWIDLLSNKFDMEEHKLTAKVAGHSKPVQPSLGI